MSAPRVVLALRPRALGDVVLCTPALRALKRGHPDRPLEVVTDARFAPLLEGLPGIDRVWPMPRDAGAMARTIVALRRRGVAMAVDLFGNPRTALLARASGAARRFGYALRGRSGAYHVAVARSVSPAPGRREHAAATHVRLAIAAGGRDDGLEPRIAVPPQAAARAPELLAEAGVRDPRRAIGLVVAGTWATKTWPWSHAAALAARLLAAGREVLVLSGPGEQAAADAVRRVAPRASLLPPCGVAELAAVIARLGGVAGTESGPRHLAVALGVPSFAWFGPTHPDTWNPADPRHGHWWTELPCRGCDRTACPHWNCMPALTPDHAAERVLAHFAAHPAPAAGTA